MENRFADAFGYEKTLEAPQEVWVGRRQKRKSRAVPKKPWKMVTGFMSNLLFVLLIGIMAFLVLSMVQSRLSGGPPGVAGYQMYIVQGGSMSPAFDAGSLVFIKPVEARNISVGDVITFQSAGGGDVLTTHRVAAVNSEEERLSFITQGDANQVSDFTPVYPENIVGQVVYALPYAGHLMNFGQTKKGLIALVFIPGSLVIFFEARNLMRLASRWDAEKERKKERRQNEA